MRMLQALRLAQERLSRTVREDTHGRILHGFFQGLLLERDLGRLLERDLLVLLVRLAFLAEPFLDLLAFLAFLAFLALLDLLGLAPQAKGRRAKGRGAKGHRTHRIGAIHLVAPVHPLPRKVVTADAVVSFIVVVAETAFMASLVQCVRQAVTGVIVVGGLHSVGTVMVKCANKTKFGRTRKA